MHKSIPYMLLGIAWLAATVALVYSFIGMLVFFSETWWEIPLKVFKGIEES
jgi:hypothetical protein